MAYGGMDTEGVMIPVLESWCKYIDGAKYEDEKKVYIKKVKPKMWRNYKRFINMDVYNWS